MQTICTSLQTDNHTNTSYIFTGWMLTGLDKEKKLHINFFSHNNNYDTTLAVQKTAVVLLAFSNPKIHKNARENSTKYFLAFIASFTVKKFVTVV